jgi:hypothetical protein
LRKFVDQTLNNEAKKQLEQVLSARDDTIRVLAKANQGIKSKLQEVFLKPERYKDRSLAAVPHGSVRRHWTDRDAFGATPRASPVVVAPQNSPFASNVIIEPLAVNCMTVAAVA